MFIKLSHVVNLLKHPNSTTCYYATTQRDVVRLLFVILIYNI